MCYKFSIRTLLLTDSFLDKNVASLKLKVYLAASLSHKFQRQAIITKIQSFLST